MQENIRTEEALRASEARFRKTFEDSVVGIEHILPGGKWLRVNNKLCEILGYSKEELLSLNYKKLTHEDDVEREAELKQKLLNREIQDFSIEKRYIKKDGGYVWAQLSCSLMQEPENNITYIVSIIEDITERKLQEKKLEDAFLKLQESESRLNDAQKLAHVGSFTYDLVTGKIEWSEETFNIFEMDPQKGVPESDIIIRMWHPDDLPWISEVIQDGLDNKKVINFESRLLLPDNKTKYISYVARGIYDSRGKPIKHIGAIADITDRKLQELELLKTLEDLKRSNHELEQFAYVASHDLQEPIRMVSTYTMMLERQLKSHLDEKAKQCMYFITSGAKRMHSLIQDLLAYSRVTSKNEPFISTDLNDMLAEIMREFHIAITDHNVEIISHGLPTVKADPAQIKLVFQNLIQNAIKFRSKERPFIEIRAEKARKEWIFSVKDNGIGIPVDAYEKIFEVFQRLHEKEIYPGSGIGLSICKKVVERHGGKIWVRSEEGKGSEFYFTLPG